MLEGIARTKGDHLIRAFQNVPKARAYALQLAADGPPHEAMVNRLVASYIATQEGPESDDTVEADARNYR